MKNIFLIIIISIALFTACNNDNDVAVEQPDDVQVGFTATLEASQLKSTGGDYDRNGAPVHVSGINIIATNTTYSAYAPVDSTFMFVDEGQTGDDIVMTVKTGWNTFTAEGIPVDDLGRTYLTHYTRYGMPVLHHYFSSENDAQNPNHLGHYKLPWRLDDPNYDELPERAAAYSDMILDTIPILGVYTAEKSQNIEFNITNNVDFTLSPQNGRIQIVFENDTLKDLGFQFRGVIRETATKDTLTWDHDDDPLTGEKDLEHYGIHSYEHNATAWIFNHVRMTAGTEVCVWLAKRPKSAQSAIDFEPIFEELVIPVEVGKNITYMFYFDGSEETSFTSTSVDFEAFTEINTDGTDL